MFIISVTNKITEHMNSLCSNVRQKNHLQLYNLVSNVQESLWMPSSTPSLILLAQNTMQITDIFCTYK